MTTLCIVLICRGFIDGHDHEDKCSCPGAALAGLLVCGHHADTAREQLREIPELWAIIGAKPQAGGRGGTGEPASPLSVPALEARENIKRTLVIWCQTLAEPAPSGRDATLPVEETVAAGTRAEILRHHRDATRCDTEATMALRWLRDPARPRADPDLEGQRLYADALNAQLEAKAARRRAQQPREDRETGRDIIEALREHVDRHLAWLLAQPEHASQLVHDVQVMHHIATTAIPSRGPNVRVVCACGTRVAIDTEPGTVTACPGCGWRGTSLDWRNRETPTTPGPLTLRDLPDWLLANHRLEVTHKQLRNWHDRGVITPHNLVMSPARYDPETVAIIAHHRIGRRTA